MDKRENLTMECAWCGESHEIEEMVSPDGSTWYCSQEHAQAAGWRTCAECGAWYMYGDGARVHSGPGYCSDECAESAGCVRCDRCGDWIQRNSRYRVDVDGMTYCHGYCAERDGYLQCDHCGDWVYRDETQYIYSVGYVCECCLESGNYERCDRCGEYAEIGDMYQTRNGLVCESCYHGDDTDYINEYSYKPVPVFHGTGSLFLGVELEIERRNGAPVWEMSDTIHEFDASERYIYQKSDGSLDAGIEIVSHPMTLHEHASWVWDDVLSECVDAGWRSHDTHTCGLHVHVSRAYAGDYDEAEAWSMRLWSLITNMQASFIEFSRRDDDSMHWCRYDDRLDYKVVRGMPDNLKMQAWRKYSSTGGKVGRYHALNLANANTVEFRMFRGTLNYQTFLATLALVDGMARFAKSFDMDACEACSFDYLIRWIIGTCTSPKCTRALVEYCKSRALIS